MYSVESSYRVYDDENGYYWEIGPDPDDLGCVQVTYYEDNEAPQNQQIVAPPEAAILIAEAMIKVAQHYKQQYKMNSR